MSDVEGPLKSLATRRQPFIGRVSDAASRSNETLEAVSVTRLQDLQRLVGNHVVAGLMPSRSPVLQLTAQRQVFKEGSKG